MMRRNMEKKYWMITSQWSLIDSMATESVSPHSFYCERSFGSDLSRYVEGSERANHLLLMREEPKGDYAIEISEALIDTSLLMSYGKKGTMFLYPGSIHFRKGMVRFRFSSEELMKSFIAETDIMLEVKCTSKYSPDFYVSDSGKEFREPEATDLLALEDQSSAIGKDDRRNFVKGAVMGYARGCLINAEKQEVTDYRNALNALKNALTGMHTRLLVDSDFLPDHSFVEQISKVEELYHKAYSKESRAFNVMKLLFTDLLGILRQRYDELQKQKGPGQAILVRSLEADLDSTLKEVARIELDSNINEYVRELDMIKAEEERMGRAAGKSRQYYPKGSAERARKDYLKGIIEDFRKNNSTYRELTGRVSQIKSQLSEIATGTTQYDGALAPAFNSLSDVIVDLMEHIKKDGTVAEADLSCFSLSGEGELSICTKDFSDAEAEYYSLLLKAALAHPLTELRPLSVKDIMDVLLSSAKEYSSNSSTIGTPDGQTIRNALLSLWKYRNNLPGGEIVIPEGMGLMPAVIAFMVKGNDFQQMERFAANRGIRNMQYALALQGAMIGFASLPRTFTDKVITRTDIEAIMSVMD